MTDLQKEFEATGYTSWINADLYPDGKIYTQEYTQWLEKQVLALRQPLVIGSVCDMEKLNRGDKIYLDDKTKTKESAINNYLSCRDGIVEVFEYNDSSGYGSKTRLFLCENTKHEVISIVRQTWNDFTKEWVEEEMTFDTDSFELLKAIINGNENHIYGKYTLVRDY